MIKGRSREASVCDDFMLNAYQEYSVDTVADLLLPTGFLIDRATQYTGSLEKFVFLKGNTSEVYSKSEINFIDGVVDFCVFRDYFKKTRKGVIPCRVVSARIDNMDAISAGIAFTKIMNKAIDGLNIGFVVSEEGLLFTGRLFEQGNNIGCFVSDLIKTEEQYDEIVADLILGDLYNSFIDYYSYIKSVIHYTEETVPYGDTLRGAHRIPYTYIEELQDLEEHIGVSIAREIERCFFENEEPEELPYCEKVKECEEYLFKIESSRVNTMEILFEAEEMERLASEAEQKNDEMLQHNNTDENTDTDIDEETKALLDDPEDIIKMLKKKRGI